MWKHPAEIITQLTKENNKETYRIQEITTYWIKSII